MDDEAQQLTFESRRVPPRSLSAAEGVVLAVEYNRLLACQRGSANGWKKKFYTKEG